MTDHRERLERLRDQLAGALTGCSENMLPQLAGQYVKVLDALAGLPEDAPAGIVEGSVVDFKSRKASRVAAAKVESAPERKAVKRGG